ncbi:MAG: hypothetical protein QXQ50_05845 [Candidatus Bathyarchaeia archaeon]
MSESAIVRRLVEFPYLPSPASVIDAALNMVEVKPDEVFADLGCGDGSVLIKAAKKFEVYCVGFESTQHWLSLPTKRRKLLELNI